MFSRKQYKSAAAAGALLLSMIGVGAWHWHGTNTPQNSANAWSGTKEANGIIIHSAQCDQNTVKDGTCCPWCAKQRELVRQANEQWRKEAEQGNINTVQ